MTPEEYDSTLKFIADTLRPVYCDIKKLNAEHEHLLRLLKTRHPFLNYLLSHFRKHYKEQA